MNQYVSNMDEYDIEEFYDSESQKYDSKRWDSYSGMVTHKTQYIIVNNMISRSGASNFLEVGPGTGRFTRMLLDMNKNVTALDISGKMLKMLDENLVGHDNYNKLSIIKGDITDLSTDIGKYDCVLSINTLSHVPSEDKFISNISQSLKYDGQFIFNFPNTLSPYWLYAKVVNTYNRSLHSDVYTMWYNINSLTEVLKKYGFKVSYKSGQFYIPFDVPKPLVRASVFVDKLFRNKMSGFAPLVFVHSKKV